MTVLSSYSGAGATPANEWRANPQSPFQRTERQTRYLGTHFNGFAHEPAIHWWAGSRASSRFSLGLASDFHSASVMKEGYKPWSNHDNNVELKELQPELGGTIPPAAWEG